MSDIPEDSRVTMAREYSEKHHDGGVRLVLTDLLAYAEERKRVNVGLLNENTTLKKKLAEQPADKVLTNDDLIREMTERGLLTVSYQ